LNTHCALAFAKINWTLECLDVFPATSSDAGFTQIISLLSLIKLHDKINLNIKLSKKTEIQIHSNVDILPQTRNNNSELNTCYQIITKMIDQYPELSQYDFNVFIEKNIPLGSGLGGSATDAASLIHLINRAFDLNLRIDEIMRLANSVGSDTAFFASCYPHALIQGRGEQVTDLNININEKINLLLVKPPFSLTAAEVYQSMQKILKRKLSAESSSLKLLQQLKQNPTLLSGIHLMQNDLMQAPIICEKYPLIIKLCQHLLQGGCLYAQMSGSGSCVYGITKANLAGDIVQTMKKEFPQCEFFLSSTHA